MNSQYSKNIHIQLHAKQQSYNKAYFASKNELLSWASKLLDLELTTLEEMGTGAVFCQLLDACHPGTVKLNKVNWKANSETDYISNFKIFQQGLLTNDINKPIDINRLSKGKQYDLNELLQWIYGYYLNSKDDLRDTYNAKKKRGGQNFIFNNKKNEIKKKYRKKQIRSNSKDIDTMTQISSASNNLSISNTSSNYNENNYRNNYNNFNVSNLRRNLRNNNYQNIINTNKNKNIYEDTRYRNKSKQEKNNKFYQYEERILNNNNIFTQNKSNRNVSNNNINTYNNNIYNTMNRYPSNDIKKNINNNILSSSSKRNFKNIFEKTPSDYPNYNYEEEENELENDNELDMTDFIGLNEEEMKELIRQEKKDGNKIRDLKNIIRKLRTNIISKEKEMMNLKNAISEEYKLKNFYLNKLKDIEYLYFNPVIQNTNENKNTILRQLLCSNQDSTIILDENNYAYLKNNDLNNNKSIINNNNKSIMLSSKKSKSNKKIEQINDLDNDIIMENKISNNINEGKYETNMAESIYMNNNNINNNINNDNKSKKLNFSSRKNYNPNYIDNLFDSFNDISKIETNNNNNNYYYIEQKQNIIPIKLNQNESKMTQMSSYQNYNLSKSTYNINNNLKAINDENQNMNTYINYQKDNGLSKDYINGKKYLAYSEKRKEKGDNEQIRVIANKTEFKSNFNNDISSMLLNDSLHIPNI